MALLTEQVSLLRERPVPFCADGDMVFKEPWEAKAFAIVVTLSQEGRFTWSEWVDCFSSHVERATTAEAEGRAAKTYYEQWLDAMEELLVRKGVTSSEQLYAKRLSAFKPSVAHTVTKK
ncbi:Nitrile hydratase beta subunit [Caballeronia arvi]|uniref:Nitrile hydratase beta subunit n=1 Tax=Caballeronia arvi TaxID=1777135 RepID=A0A158KKE1_9BURK|nr:nitrile hydratase accessory protein [Caballeronia arvi]SAL81213.1 Nitrile hydratase beta subunit [Caballeronia arvi]